MSKSHRSLCLSFSRKGAGLFIYHLLVWSYLNFLHISPWITSPTQSCLVLYSFCASLLHSLIMWLMVSSLSTHRLHLLLLLLFYCNTWNHLTVCKKISSFSNYSQTNHICIYMHINRIFSEITHKGLYSMNHKTNHQPLFVCFFNYLIHFHTLSAQQVTVAQHMRHDH